MRAGQRVYTMEKAVLAGTTCRQVTGLCMGEEGKGLADVSEGAGRAGKNSTRIT